MFDSKVEAYAGKWIINESGVIGRNLQDTLHDFCRCTFLNLIVDFIISSLSRHTLRITTYLKETGGCAIAPLNTQLWNLNELLGGDTESLSIQALTVTT